jgi:single stranded DNA-binding protein
MTLMGRVAKEATLSDAKTQDGKSVATMSVAVNRRTKGAESVSFFWLTLFGQAADFACKLGKGSRVLAAGEPTIEQWTDKHGQKRTTCKLRVQTLQSLDARGPVKQQQDDDDGSSPPF